MSGKKKLGFSSKPKASKFDVSVPGTGIIAFLSHHAPAGKPENQLEQEDLRHFPSRLRWFRNKSAAMPKIAAYAKFGRDARANVKPPSPFCGNDGNAAGGSFSHMTFIQIFQHFTLFAMNVFCKICAKHLNPFGIVLATQPTGDEFFRGCFPQFGQYSTLKPRAKC